MLGNTWWPWACVVPVIFFSWLSSNRVIHPFPRNNLIGMGVSHGSMAVMNPLLIIYALSSRFMQEKKSEANYYFGLWLSAIVPLLCCKFWPPLHVGEVLLKFCFILNSTLLMPMMISKLIQISYWVTYNDLELLLFNICFSWLSSKHARHPYPMMVGMGVSHAFLLPWTPFLVLLMSYALSSRSYEKTKYLRQISVFINLECGCRHRTVV
jgi:hypothetical protein